MNKIPTLFQRDPADRGRLLPEVSPGCEWVLAGQGHATRKWDGTACLVRDGRLYRRAMVKPPRPDPPGFELAQHDFVTGKRFGWVPVTGGPDERWHLEGWANLHALAAHHPDYLGETPANGTYELVGPRVNGNPDGFATHELIFHGWARSHVELADLDACPRTFHELAAWLGARPYEGVVWHHPDGRMAKAKRRDFPVALPLAA